MKTIIVFIVLVVCLGFTRWEKNFDSAIKLATERNQLLLINFSGSDWCIPCIRMKKQIFDDPAFSRMADSTLVLFNADFPRNKKNLPDIKMQKQNETLADKYNPSGKFPFTILINPVGKVIKVWDGFPDETADQFAKDLKNICDDYRK